MVAESKPAVDESMILGVCADLDLFNATQVTSPEPVGIAAPSSVQPVTPSGRTDIAPNRTALVQRESRSDPSSVATMAAPEVAIATPLVGLSADAQVAPFQTLRRYDTARKQSLLRRCAAKLGFVHI
jgi:hypothetical protein